MSPSPSISPNLLGAIGNTPLVKLRGIGETSATILVKPEDPNPSGSMKNRMALAMIEDAERREPFSFKDCQESSHRWWTAMCLTELKPLTTTRSIATARELAKSEGVRRDLNRRQCRCGAQARGTPRAH